MQELSIKKSNTVKDLKTDQGSFSFQYSIFGTLELKPDQYHLRGEFSAYLDIGTMEITFLGDTPEDLDQFYAEAFSFIVNSDFSDLEVL